MGNRNRFRTFVAASACAVAIVIAAAGAGAGDAAPAPAITGPASNVTTTSAQLNGIINPNGLTTFWAFQYGTSAAYSKNTPPVGPFTGTPETVSTLVRGLTPGTTYHFSLLAIQGSAGTSGQPTGYEGGDVTFRTLGSSSSRSRGAKHAKASLRSRTLAVRHGAALVPWGCSGSRGARCQGRISLTAHGKVACGSGTFRAATGKHGNVRVTLGRACLALVKAARRHRLSASLKAIFSQGTGNLKTGVTLVLG